MKDNTYIVVATPEEVDLAKRFVGSQNIIITGVGGTNVVSSLRSLDRNSNIINIGYAGSLNLPVGTRVDIDRTCLWHPQCDYQERVFWLDDPGAKVSCYTSCDFVTSADIENCVFDMELAFIASLGFKSLRAIKIVSDNLNYKQYQTTTNND